MSATIYDVLRTLVRNQGHRDGGFERDLLLTVDAAEQGFADLDSYKDHLAQIEREEKAKQRAESDAEAGILPAGPKQLSDAELDAELARRQALRNAQLNSPPVSSTQAPPISTDSGILQQGPARPNAL